jgi:hypothetical protein
MTSILGLICGLGLAVLCAEPIYDFIWPRASDKQRGGVGYFLVFLLAPACMITGATVGALAGRNFSKHR